MSRGEYNNLVKEVIREGSGEECPQSGDEVTIHYIGSLLDGTKFANSRDQEEKFTFKLDDGRVVKGLDVGVSTMKLGEVCKLTCLPEYGYGKKGFPPTIPSDATLVFEVELFSWKGEDITLARDDGILKSLLLKGEGGLSPNHDAYVTARIKGMYLGRIFDEREVSFHIGDGEDHEIVQGVERALCKMGKGEKCLLNISPKYAFNEGGCEKYNIPANATVQYEVSLVTFTRAKEQWELSATEKLDLAERLKSKATVLLKAGEILKSLTNYTQAEETLDDAHGYSEIQFAMKTSLRLSLCLNCALCQMKLELWNDVIESCRRALLIESRNEKALFRTAQAYLGRKDYTEALDAFEKVLSIYPSNKAAKNSLSIVKQKMKQESAKIKEHYTGMFQKFAERDAQKEALKKARGTMNNEPIGYWSNDMADGMMSLHQELEAFGERMPERSRRMSNGSGDGSPRNG